MFIHLIHFPASRNIQTNINEFVKERNLFKKKKHFSQLTIQSQSYSFLIFTTTF